MANGDPNEKARRAAQRLIDQLGVAGARAALQSSDRPNARAVLAAVDDLSRGEGGGGILSRITGGLAQLGAGATEAAIAGGKVAELSPIGLMAEATGRVTGLPAPSEVRQRVEERHEDIDRPPEGATETIARVAGRLAPEFLTTGGAFRTAGRLGVTGARRALAGSLPSALTFSTSPEESSAGAVADVTGSETAERIAQNPLARFASELAINVGAEGLFAVAGRALKGRKTANQLAAQADDLEEGARRARPDAATEMLQTEADMARRAANVARAGDVDPDEFVNVAKFNLDETGEAKLRDSVRRVVAEEGLAPKEVVPNEQTIAESLGLDPGDILSKPAKRLNRTEMLAARNVVKQNIEQIDNITKRLRDPDLPIPERERIVELQSALEDENRAVLSHFVRARSEAGRNLQSLKILAQNSLDPFTWLTKAKRQLGSAPLTDDIMARVADLAKKAEESGDPSDLIDYVARLREPTRPEKVATLWKAGLLTLFKTFGANFTGNTTMAALESVKDVPAFMIDRLVGSATGLQTKALSFKGTFAAPLEEGFLRAFPKSASADARALWRSIETADTGPLREALSSRRRYGVLGRLTRQVQTSDNVLAKVDIHRSVRFNNAFLDLYTNGVFHALSSASLGGDDLFSNIAARLSIEEQARVLARRGLGQGDSVAERVAWLRENPTDEMALNAIAQAEFSTFRDRTALGSMVGGLKRQVGTGSEFVVPFSATPTSIATKVAKDYSPVGGIKAMYDFGRRVILGNIDEAAQRKFANELGRSITGTGGLVALGAWLYEKGLITGALPDSQSERDTLFRTRTPNSVLLDGAWHSLERISPAGNLVLMGAHIIELARNEALNPVEKAVRTAGAAAKTLTEQPFLTGTKQILDLITEPSERRFSNFTGRFASSFIPNIVRGLTRGTDPTVRETEGIGDEIVASVPGLSRSLPARLGAFGEEITRDQGVISQIANPLGSVPDKRRDDPLLAEMDRVGAVIRNRRPTDDPDLTREQYEARVKVEGRVLRRVLERVTESPAYQDLTDAQKKEALEDAVSRVRRRVTNRLKDRGILKKPVETAAVQ